jgi:lipopolysaccharide transport system ATP-binding protein
MPFLSIGAYTIVVAAVSDGAQMEHIHQQWIDDALHLEVQRSHIIRGLVGLPMRGIELIMESNPQPDMDSHAAHGK